MKEDELQKELDKIRKGMKIFDTLIGHEWSEEEEKFYISKKQSGLVKDIFNLFKSLSWQLALNSYKSLSIAESDPIKIKGCGTPVKVRPCKEEYEGKTYFGILIGDVPLHIGAEIDKEGNLNITRQMHNPAIFIPELKDIVYGVSSWWGEIETEEELDQLITDDTIKNVWYMKLLKDIGVKK